VVTIAIKNVLASLKLFSKTVFRVLTTLENMEISGNLLILENSGNLKFTQGIYQIVSLGHRVVCIIVSNSSVNWLGDTATGVDGASHHALSSKSVCRLSVTLVHPMHVFTARSQAVCPSVCRTRALCQNG